MIISCSRRTDIPACYSDWFFHRIRAGFVCVRNPVNPRRISRINLSPDVVDGIMFWTKNPIPMLDRLNEVSDYTYYFQFTLTPYDREIEPNLPPKDDLLDAFRRLSDTIGADRVIWRYDPILFNASWTLQAHLEAFANMAERLSGCTKQVVISFLDTEYRNVRRNEAILAAGEMTAADRLSLAAALANIAKDSGMSIVSCAEMADLQSCGIAPSRCVDKRIFENQLGCRLAIPKDKNQRPACGCDASVDIGMYNTCRNGCRYCYANYNASQIEYNAQKHSPTSPLLSGEIGERDIVVERQILSCRDPQVRMDEKIMGCTD